MDGVGADPRICPLDRWGYWADTRVRPYACLPPVDAAEAAVADPA
jgi:hypothetical protein